MNPGKPLMIILLETGWRSSWRIDTSAAAHSPAAPAVGEHDVGGRLPEAFPEAPPRGEQTAAPNARARGDERNALRPRPLARLDLGRAHVRIHRDAHPPVAAPAAPQAPL